MHPFGTRERLTGWVQGRSLAGPRRAYAVYGYEAISLILDAIQRAGAKGGDRAAVVEQIFATKDREGVVGTYGIDKNGDITLTPYGAYRIKGGELVFDHRVQPQT